MAALYAAEDCGIPFSGWVPLHYTNEVGGFGIPERFRPFLHETGSKESAERTERNIKAADGILTLRFASSSTPSSVAAVRQDDDGLASGPAFQSPGTQHGIDYAEQKLGLSTERLFFVDLPLCDTGEELALAIESTVQQTLAWIEALRVEKCAIGGPRESEAPGIQAKAYIFLKTLMSRLETL